MGNTPCSSQEIANCIVKYRLAVLGGPNPSATVSARIGQYLEYSSRLQSSNSALLAKLEDRANPSNAKYYLPYGNGSQLPTELPGSLSRKRPSSLMDQPMKRIKPNFLEESEMVASLPFEDSWNGDNASAIAIDLYDQNRNAFNFDTIIPIEYESSSDNSTCEESPNDGDESVDDRTDMDSSSECELEPSDFCEDMMNGDLEFDFLTNMDSSQDTGLSALLSDQGFHSDSAHSTESGASSESPLMTPEPSPRRDSESLDAISTIQPSFFDDAFLNQGAPPDAKCDIHDALSIETLQIPELDELLGINGIGHGNDNITTSSKMDILIMDPEPISTDQLLDSKSIDQSEIAQADDSLNGLLTSPALERTVAAPHPVDEVSSFLRFEDLEKDVVNTTADTKVMPAAPQSHSKLSQPIPSSTQSAKTKSRSTKHKGRVTAGAEFNPNMLISPVASISPQIYITMVESLPFYVTTVGPAEGLINTYQLLRRYDSGYVNATTLLSVGGVESEKEQAVVLSLEVGRIRIRRRESPLFGTWIPLQRARQLAATCSLQHKLGPFLDYDLSNYFPSQLPPHIAAFNPAQVSSRLKQFMRSRAASLKPRDNYVANIGIAPRCLHPTSKSFFSGVGHQLNQILGLQSKQMKSYSALDDSTSSRRPSKSKANPNDLDEIQPDTAYSIEEGSEVDGEEFSDDISSFLDLDNPDHFTEVESVSSVAEDM
ncbi:hypothetical protein K493DRAFT_409934 [Basidiobolus meristosporus CBS 931.73]|uniref:HTH APSES-type domain-containing protein n=1 Tax=Basidiobolus meristosporus CBS 931.73 TaxID=1314790 RepID=A0A1Y1XY76_9FUNG|nr:hypothetical protein K493DRAFT_409934 [Basidiobolus meristosporus CBS 931.73]|eukprot:ORX90314.1 hypothetical protein K493DRAFT_409934 [Basidiobolus meristosporus CBS 931.73]